MTSQSGYSPLKINQNDVSEAVKLIYSIYKDPVKGTKEKKEFNQNVGLHEVFLESAPTALIITVIMIKANPGEK